MLGAVLLSAGAVLYPGPMFSAEASTNAAAPPAPKVYFPEPIYDFGTVTVGQVIQHVFLFTNTGAGVFKIQDVKSPCGCASAGAWSRNTAPGASGTIPVEFHTGHFKGPVSKVFTVESNDPLQPERTLQLKGVVWHPIDIDPASAAFSGVLDNPTNLSRTVHIINREAGPLLLGAAKSSQRTIAAEIITNEPGQSYDLKVSLVPPLGAGHVFGQVVIPTSSKTMPTLEVPVWAVAQPAVMVLPPQVDLPAGPLSRKLTRSISVRNNAATPLELSDLSLSAPGVDAKLVEMQKGEYFTVMLTFPEGFTHAKGQPFDLSFRSNNPKFPLLHVPIVER